MPPNSFRRSSRGAGPRSTLDSVAGVKLSHSDRVLDAASGLTKMHLAQYYEAVADRMLPHVADRPLMIARCPAGVGATCFYQKHLSSSVPAGVRGIPIREKGARRLYLCIDDVTGLVSLAQIGALEIHTWGSRADRIEQPDRIVFDLDPAPDVPWSRVASAAQHLRSILRGLGLECFLKLSGGKGLHVVVPIERRADWEEVTAFARTVAGTIATNLPNQFVATMSKAKRTGRIFIDYLRNQRGATCIAPYSTRARPGTAISLPIDWDELAHVTSAAQFNVPDVHDRLGRPDPWRDMDKSRQRIPISRLRRAPPQPEPRQGGSDARPRHRIRTASTRQP